MKNHLLSIFSLFCILSSLSGQTQSQTSLDSLEMQLQAIYESSTLPGFAAAIVTPDEIHFQKGFGYADVASKKPYTHQTIQNIGSVSKTFIGVSLMQLVEAGKLDLNRPINELLPFEVKHPRHLEKAITVHQLATHSSGIIDRKIYNEKCYVLKDTLPENLDEFAKADKKYLLSIEENKEQALGDFLKDYLHSNGAYYKKKNFHKEAPGTKYEYSNIGSALAAYIVELVSGQTYADYVQSHILKPIKMDQSSLRLSDIDMENHASLYTNDGQRIPQYTLVTYPDGGMLTNCNNLALYLKEMMNGYLGNSELLEPATFQEMMKVHMEGDGERMGFFWDINKRDEIGHNGADPGVFTMMKFDPKTGADIIGLIVIFNCLAYEDEVQRKSFIQVWRTLHKYKLPQTE